MDVEISTSTRWPNNVKLADRNIDNIIFRDGTYISRFFENEVNFQWTTWRIELEYDRASASVDEQLFTELLNPVSGFQTEHSNSLLRGNLTERMTVTLHTIADAASLPSLGSGHGYQLINRCTSDINLRVLSVTRHSALSHEV